jgi:hypothetical protein
MNTVHPPQREEHRRNEDEYGSATAEASSPITSHHRKDYRYEAHFSSVA